LSTLTKILIVLLTVSSIFLCGIVATYVANADNYKDKYDQQQSELSAKKQTVKSLTQQLNEKIDQAAQKEKNLNNRISIIKKELSSTQIKLNNAEREKADLLQRVNSWTAIVKDFTETNDKQGTLLKNTLEELKKAKAEAIKKQRELDETTAYLQEKMAIIETLERDKKQLVEQKTDLQNKLDEFLRAGGRIAGEPQSIVQPPGKVHRVQTVAEEIGLKAVVTAVDLNNSMASISIGKADGVKEGMRFHITRADEFICDVLILDVETEKAAGVLEMVQKPPKAGDNASTNF